MTSLAFLLFKNPGQVPRIVQLPSESYNPHVRCGATLALGIACAGTGPYATFLGHFHLTRIQVPEFEFVSNARPSLFAYPPPTTPPTRETFAKAATAVLSTTTKVKAREKKRKAAADVDAIDTVRVVALTMNRFFTDSCGTADEKAEPKKDGDVEMKGDVTYRHHS